MLYKDMDKKIDRDFEPYVNLDNYHYGFYCSYGWIECGLIKNVEILSYGKYTVLFGQNGAKEWCYAITDVKKGEGDFIGEGSGYKKQLVFEDLMLDMEDLGVNIEESKKSARRSLKESFKAPKDWDFDKMLKEYGMEYMSENSSDNQDCVNYMEDLQYAMESEGLEWLLDRLYFGGQWIRGDFNAKETFDHHEEYFVVNGYGNFYSLSEYYLDDYVKDTIENVYGEEEFYNWCVDQGYFESDEE